MKSTFGKDLTNGSVPKHLLGFALPILIGNLLSTGYSIINTIWVGNLLGRDAVGAVAVSFPVFLGMLALCSGTTLATSILISRAYGAKDSAQIQRIVNHSWTLAMVVIPLITLGGLLLAKPLLMLLGTPTEIMAPALAYLKISIWGFAGLYLSYLIASILRGIGDTTIPLFFIILSTVVNAVLDPLLILGVGPLPTLGLSGAAYASLIASGLATLLGLIYVLRRYAKEPINPNQLMFDKTVIVNILGIGLPSFVQQMLVSLGYAFMTAFVNGFGPAAIAAFGIASRIDSIVAMPAIAMMMAASSLTAQNLGAQKPERISDVFKWGMILNAPVIGLIALCCMLFAQPIMKIFVNEPEVIRIGVSYLKTVGPGYLFFIVFYVSNGIINGAGKTLSTMAISFISLCLIRIPLAAVLSKTGLGIQGIWAAIVISFIVTTFNSLLYYFSKRWKPAVQPESQMV